MDNRILIGPAVGAAMIFSAGASAQQPPAPPPYGSPGVTLDQAKKASDAAEAEAKKNGWRMAIVVVSNAGDLIHFSRIDDTQFGSTDVAIRKAKSAAAFRRPTKVFQDALTANSPALPILTLGAIARLEAAMGEAQAFAPRQRRSHRLSPIGSSKQGRSCQKILAFPRRTGNNGGERKV